MGKSSNPPESGQLPAPAAPVVKKRKSTTEKPPKPYDEYPLTAHAVGQWCRKIRGKVEYFGPWGKRIHGKLVRIEGDGWKEALDRYKEQADDLYAGRKPREKSEGLTVADACNAFLIAKDILRAKGAITQRTRDEYKETTDRIIATFGKNRRVDDLAADDFNQLLMAIPKTWGPWRQTGEIQRVRTVFKHCYDSHLLEQPVRFGPLFKKPSKKTMRVHRAGRGSRMIDAATLRLLVEKAKPQLKAMILLALNCGFGNDDCASLPLSIVHGDWLEFPRPKTGIARKCPLWPETMAALKAVIAERKPPKDPAHADLVFITKYGGAWAGKSSGNPITAEFRKLANELEVYRQGVSFYSLRHVFRTVADSTLDIPATRLIMGHVDGSIDDTYREHVDDARLRAVAEHVRKWLFPPTRKTVKSSVKS
jgi:integrase